MKLKILRVFIVQKFLEILFEVFIRKITEQDRLNFMALTKNYNYGRIVAGMGNISRVRDRLHS